MHPAETENTGSTGLRGALAGAAAACALHAPALALPFWQDDYGLLLRVMQAPLAEVLLPSDPGLFWRPLAMGAWWWGGAQLWGANALAFHAANLALLFAVGTLAGLAAARLAPGGERFHAGFAAFLFAGHGAFLLPAGWACGAQELLALLFLLSAVLAWQSRRSGLLLIAAACAYASKEGTLVLPALLAVLEIATGRRRWRDVSAVAALAAVWLAVRSRYVAPPQPGSPYELTAGLNVVRNAAALAAFSLNVPREAVHLAAERHRALGAAWAALAGGLFAAGIGMSLRGWHAALGGRRGWAAAAVWFAAAIAPYLLLRWNCYPYYALVALLPLAVLGGWAPRRAMACFALSSAVAAWGQWLAPYPATVARAWLAEASLRAMESAGFGKDAPLRVEVGPGATSDFHAVGWEDGIALRTGVPRAMVQRVEKLPAEGAGVIFVEGGGVRIVRPR